MGKMLKEGLKMKYFISMASVLILIIFVTAQEIPDKDEIESMLKLSLIQHPEFDDVEFNVSVTDNIVNFYVDIPSQWSKQAEMDLFVKTVITIGNLTSVTEWKSDKLYIRLPGTKYRYILTKDCRRFVKFAETGDGEGLKGFLWIIKHSKIWDKEK